MNEAQTIHEYATFLEQSQKEFEVRGVWTNFRRMADGGVSYFMQVTNGIRLDRIVQNKVVVMPLDQFIKCHTPDFIVATFKQFDVS